MDFLWLAGLIVYWIVGTLALWGLLAYNHVAGSLPLALVATSVVLAFFVGPMVATSRETLVRAQGKLAGVPAAAARDRHAFECP